MMQAINETPIDYLTWGNHEADIEHKKACEHVRNYQGTFINSNMQEHEAMDAQVPYEIITITSPDGTQTRKIGLIAVLSDDPKLYSQFKGQAFGGATIEDPWNTLRYYDKLLREEHGCDLVIPLEHLYLHENRKTCEEFDFPIILSGHDHHEIDETIDGTRILKPGQDAVKATVLEIKWCLGDAEPTIGAQFVPTGNFQRCPKLWRRTRESYNVLLPLRHSELMSIPSQFMPLSSCNARGSVCSMGRLICSLLQTALEVDAVLLMGGNIRGNEDYADASFFSMETLLQEIKEDEVVGIVSMPGYVLAAGIEATHAGAPIPGWFQFDIGVNKHGGNVHDNRQPITTVGGKPIEPNRLYRVATKVKDLTEDEAQKIRKVIQENVRVEGDLRKEVTGNIKRLMEIGSYRGVRHRKGLPVRGQRTSTNARTRKGPRRATIAGKKKVKK